MNDTVFARRVYFARRGRCDLCGCKACSLHAQVIECPITGRAVLLCAPCFVDPSSVSDVTALLRGAAS